jgi:hypothetical protein
MVQGRIKLYTVEVAQRRVTESKLRYKKRNKLQNRAMVYAERETTLKNKCEWCDSIEKLGRHHFDYSKPLEVLTLCSKCHKDADRIRRRTMKRLSTPPIVHCDNCLRVYPDCSRGHPSHKGRGCTLGIPKDMVTR